MEIFLNAINPYLQADLGCWSSYILNIDKALKSHPKIE